jgi:hypothetical protein
MMVGYSTDHTSDCYKMWDPATGGVHKTSDIIWLKRVYFPKVSLDLPSDGDDIQVTITVQHSSIEAGEGEPDDDSDTTEVETVNIETIHNDDESDESKEDEALEDQSFPNLKEQEPDQEET